MRVLVTGTKGFIGSHVAHRLLERGHEVVAAARQPDTSDGGMKPVFADLACDDLAPLVRNCDAVVHCAALAAPWGARARFMRDNVQATQHLVAAALASSTVRRFVYLSSPSIYFDYKDRENIGEEVLPSRWSTNYAESKWLAEKCVLKARDIGPLILRPRAVFGVGDRVIVPRILAVARSGYLPLPRGGDSHIDITYIDNVVDAIELALQAPASTEGRAYNITNGEPMPVRVILQKLFDAMHLRVRMLPVPRAIAMAGAATVECAAKLCMQSSEPRITRYSIALLAYHQTLSIAAARAQLGYAPRISITEGMARLASPGAH